MKTLSAAKFLVESGLLFEINRKVMHPRGLALEVKQNDDGTIVMSQELQDWRDEDGIEFGPESIERGEKKLAVTDVEFPAKPPPISPERLRELQVAAEEAAADCLQRVKDYYGIR